MMLSKFSYSSFFLFLQILFSAAQNTGRLFTTPQDANEGAIIFPRDYPLTFREGSSINISWTTSYQNINLFYYQRGNVANSIQLATNQRVPWFQWAVFAEEKNLTEPFVFRVVNAQGTEAEKVSGGFWSASYYIARGGTDGSSSSSSSISSTSAATAATPSSSIASSLPTNRAVTASSKGNSSSSTAPALNRSDKRKTTIGLGVGISVGLFVIVAVSVFMFFKRKQRKAANRTEVDKPSMSEVRPEHFEEPAHHSPNLREMYVNPAELEGSRKFFELPAHRANPRVNTQEDVWDQGRP